MGVAEDRSEASQHWYQHRALLAEVSIELGVLANETETMELIGQRIACYFGAERCVFAEADAEVPISSPAGGAALTASVASDGEVRFRVSVIDAKPRTWREDEAELLQELAERVWARLERVRTAEELRRAQLRLEDVLETASMAYWTWDARTQLTVASPSMSELFGVHEGESILTAPCFEIIHPEDRGRHRALVEDARARGIGWHTEFRIVRPRDGEIAWLEERATVMRDPGSGVVYTMGLVWDITDRKRAEALADLERRANERDAFRRALGSAEEAERRRLALELHDQLGQHLTAITLGLSDVRRLLDAGQAPDARLAQLEEMTRLMTRDTRYLAIELRPPELDDVGLNSALHTYVEQWSARYGVLAEVGVTGAAEQRLPGDVATTIYRVVQEALTNVAKHARAGHVSVLVGRSADEVRLTVEDDGRGFDVDAAMERSRRNGRLGLDGMRERAALVGGTLDVESRRGGTGTTVYLRVPIAQL